jgi:hypothetical protein
MTMQTRGAPSRIAKIVVKCEVRAVTNAALPSSPGE